MGISYFAGDGSYGSGSEVVMLVTADWTTEDWDAVDSARDHERMDVAMGIYLRKNAEYLAAVGEVV